MDKKYIEDAKAILGEIGLGLNQNNEVYDQDTFNNIQVAGKNLIFSFKPEYNVFCANNQVLFQPFENRKMIMQLFGYYLQKETACGNANYVTWNVNELPDKKTSISVVDALSRETTTTDAYMNPCLAFCDFILKCGYPMECACGEFNLTMYEGLYELKER